MTEVFLPPSRRLRTQMPGEPDEPRPPDASARRWRRHALGVYLEAETGEEGGGAGAAGGEEGGAGAGTGAGATPMRTSAGVSKEKAERAAAVESYLDAVAAVDAHRRGLVTSNLKTSFRPCLSCQDI